MSKRPNSPLANPEETPKLSKYDEALFGAIEAKKEEQRREEEQRQQELFIPLELPSEEEMENKIIPSIVEVIAKSAFKETFSVTIGRYVSDIPPLLLLADHWYFPKVDAWRANSLERAGSSKERMFVNKHVSEHTFNYLLYIESEWNKRHTVAKMTMRQDLAKDAIYMDIKISK